MEWQDISTAPKDGTAVVKIRGQRVYTHAERLARLSKPDEATGCINWTSSTRNGYGSLSIGSRTDGTRRTVRAHRLAFETFVGPIPDGMEICHHCDNRRCINPKHLFAGTHQDNIDDREAKGRNRPQRGESNVTSKLTEPEVISMRRLRQKGLTYAAIAARFGVHKKTAMQIVKGEQWAHVPFPPPPAQEQKP